MCQSIRGLAPLAQQFEFDFAGKSNLIYGSNGSGKSSLLAAVLWVILGTAVTDADDPDETAPIRATVQKGKNPKKINDWPVMAALPDFVSAAVATTIY
jgi:predicted ATPase